VRSGAMSRTMLQVGLLSGVRLVAMASPAERKRTAVLLAGHKRAAAWRWCRTQFHGTG
jgi:hypothetical protein